MNQLPNYQKDNSSPTTTVDEYRFTETFYGQLVTNLDEVFEEIFFSPLEQSFEKDSQAPTQVTYDETTLRMLFAEIATVYVEPAKVFIINLEEKKATISESQTACCALMDISCAANTLGLSTLCNKIALLITEIKQWSCLTNTSNITSKKDTILLIYGELTELLPQTFKIEQSHRSNAVIKPATSVESGVHTAIDITALNLDLTFYHYPPRLHQHIEIVEQPEKGQSAFWFKDTRSNRYFKAGKRERDIILLIDGSRTLKEVCQTIKEQMNLNVKPAQLAQIITKLDSIGLIDGVDDKNLKKKTLSNYNNPLNMMDTRTFRLTNPDHFFTKVNNLLPWVFTKTFVLTSLILMALVMLTVSSQYNEFYNHGHRILKEYGFLFNYICFLIVVSLHEIGHGITCKHYGGRVTDVGVIIFGLVLPGAYCNISDIYLFKHKRHRVYALLAGLYTQFLIATIAAVGALIFTTHTFISDLCYIVFFSATASTVINLIPLIKLDGYYILTNLLDEY
ncbi:MAG: peptidase M50, partial [bacterium]